MNIREAFRLLVIYLYGLALSKPRVGSYSTRSLSASLL